MQCTMQVLNSKSSSSFFHTFLQWLIEQGAAGIIIANHACIINYSIGCNYYNYILCSYKYVSS